MTLLLFSKSLLKRCYNRKVSEPSLLSKAFKNALYA
jgi:hypothetical protein